MSAPLDTPSVPLFRWRPSPPRWSAFDLHCVLKIVAVMTAWKLWSLDYSALVELVGQPALHPLSLGFLTRLVDWLHGAAASDLAILRGTQIAAGLLLVAGTWRRRRSVTALGLVAAAAVYLPAQRYSAWMYDIELGWCLLALGVMWPGSWRTLLDGSRAVSARATSLGIAWQVYFAAAYFFCGWSKFRVSPWWFLEVRLELLHPVMRIWHGSEFNPAQLARGYHELLLDQPWLGCLMALVTLLAELGWCLALVSPWARRVLPLLLFAIHTSIFLTSGILFLHLATLQLACVIRWRGLSWRGSEGLATALGAWRDRHDRLSLVETRPQRRLDRRGIGMAALALLAVVVPSVWSTQWGLLANWNQFGWSYGFLARPATYYRLGYRDRTTGEVEPAPLNHAGFMDFRGVSGPRPHLARLSDSADSRVTPARRERSLAALEVFRTLIRDGDSNRWLLGPLSCPAHLVAPSPRLARDELQELIVLRGEIHYDLERRRLVGDWASAGPLPRRDRDSAAKAERLARRPRGAD